MARTGQQLRRRTAAAIGSRSTPDTAAVARGRSGRLRYWFDNSMSRGTPALIAWLAATTAVLIVVFALFTALLGLRPGHGLIYNLFYALLHALDPGTVGGDTGSWQFLLTMLVLTIAGLFIMSALIGVVSAGIDNRIANLRRGRSRVVETGHTVILGWSHAVFTIVRELAVANESRRRPAIVILADKDKPEMEDELHAKVPDLRGTRVVCRTGSPIDVADLALTAHAAARSIIVLSPDADEPDTAVIKTLLALTHGGDGEAPIVAEIQESGNLEAGRLVGAGRAALIDMRETAARLIVQAARQPGVAAVFTQLFDFEGAEIYFVDEHPFAQATYGQAQLSFMASSLIGVIDVDGTASLNPAADEIIGGRTLIVVAEDDANFESPILGAVRVDERAFSEDATSETASASSLLIGWNRSAEMIVREMDGNALPGSTLTLLTSFGTPAFPPLQNLIVSHEACRTTDRAVLERHVHPGLDQIVVLCYSDDLPVQEADARTLVTLLHVRDILGDNGPAVVTEMLDDHNRQLAEVADVDDVIVSDLMLSLMMSQLSEDPRLVPVFADLLGGAGADIYLRPVGDYVRIGTATSFGTLVAAASRRGETAFGYAAEGEVPIINPAKSETFLIDDRDRLVVLANG